MDGSNETPAIAGLHILTPDGKPVRGVLERIPACARLSELGVDADGSLSFSTDGWAAQWHEESEPVMIPHPNTQRVGFVFLDHAGNEHHEHDLLLCLPDARIPDCPDCARAALRTEAG